MDNKVYVVLAYDCEGYVINAICKEINMITEEMLVSAWLKIKVIKVELNKVLDKDLIDYEEVLLT